MTARRQPSSASPVIRASPSGSQASRVQHRSASSKHGRRGRPSSSPAAAQRKVQRQRTLARRARSRRNPGSGEGASSGERREPRPRRARTGDPRAEREQEGRPKLCCSWAQQTHGPCRSFLKKAAGKASRHWYTLYQKPTHTKRTMLRPTATSAMPAGPRPHV